jgi:repressor LexA
MSARPLTTRQRRVLEVIAALTRAGGRPPTLRELGEALAITSTNGVRDHLQALIDKGYLRRDVRSARGIQLTRLDDGSAPAGAAWPDADGPAADVVHVPVVGRVAAGQPLLAEQNIEQYLTVDRGIIRDGDVFALRVQGDSMRDAGILDGDYVFVRQQATAEPRDIVVVVLDDEATVKRFVPAGRSIRLEPANPVYRPIVVDRDDPRLSILGKVCAVLRTIR